MPLLEIVLTLSLIVITTSATNINLSRNVKVISSRDSPCSAIEITEPTHFSNSVRPLEVELDLSLNATQLYEEVYGTGATKAETHEGHFQCHEKHIAALDSGRDVVFKNFQDAIEIRVTNFEVKRRTRAASAALHLIMSVASLVGEYRQPAFVGQICWTKFVAFQCFGQLSKS